MCAGMCEDEPVAGDTRLVTVGEYSHHAILYSRLHGAHEALVDFLIEITDPGMDTAEVWRDWHVESYDEWPLERRDVAVEWLEWLLRPDERRAGFPALCGFIAHENGLSREDHIARDDAGRYSLVRAADDALSRYVDELVEDGKMESLPGMDSPGCAICSRAVRSCIRWAQLQPCRHWLVDLDAEYAHPWLSWHECSRGSRHFPPHPPFPNDVPVCSPCRICADCREEWMRVADGTNESDESSGEGMEVEGDECVSCPQVCPLCRATVVTWRISRVRATS